jgi:hypothetical protein
MKARKPVCPYCNEQFVPSPFHPNQKVCLSPECQRRRRTDYHRQKVTTDSEYRLTCAESRKKWRESNPDYQSQYRDRNEDYCQGNRKKQRIRNQKRRLSLIVKNNLAIDLKRLPAEVWMTGPGLDGIVKNNLAISQVLIFQIDGDSKGGHLT